MQRRLFSRALVLVVLSASSSACSEAARDPKQFPISREELERNAQSDDPAELSYRRYCMGCHGSDGHGNGGTTGADLASVTGPLSQRSDAELFTSVRNGKGGSIAVMPAHSPVMSDAQITAVIGYVRKRFGQPAAPAPSAAPAIVAPAAPDQAVPTVAVPAKVASPASAATAQ